jgi:hypothetical protein
MAYRVNAQFKDGSTNGSPADVIAAAPPRCGETISVSRGDRDVAMKVTAVWTPSAKMPGKHAEGLIMVEAREV